MLLLLLDYIAVHAYAVYCYRPSTAWSVCRYVT